MNLIIYSAVTVQYNKHKFITSIIDRSRRQLILYIQITLQNLKPYSSSSSIIEKNRIVVMNSEIVK